jgi:hypothetical protein
MEIGSTSLLGAGSRCCSRILIIPVILLCLPLCCCLAFAAAGFFSISPRSFVQPMPTLEIIPPVQTVPVIPAIPAKTTVPDALLDPQAMPLSGSASLGSGFSPDPYRVDLQAGGSVDTSGFSPACGYTSYHPAFVLEWQTRDVPQSFLRLFFTPADKTATALLVHTPEGEWLCDQGSSSTDPIVDIPQASPGEYAIWIGTREKGSPVEGSLSITGSQDVTP